MNSGAPAAMANMARVNAKITRRAILESLDFMEDSCNNVDLLVQENYPPMEASKEASKRAWKTILLYFEMDFLLHERTKQIESGFTRLDPQLGRQCLFAGIKGSLN